jgi:DNA-binding NarL/FixJ family response regulator
MSRARVLLAEDHAEVAELLHGILAAEFEVVATVGDGPALLAAAERLRPDVIVSDVAMPGLDGIAAARAILRGDPDARIVFVSVHDEPVLMRRGLAAGALGYVLKRDAGEELVPAIRAALRGERSPLPGAASGDP